MRTRTYYESPEYECEDKPGEFAAITIIGDDDGPHFVFSSGDQVILDLPIPPCEALAIRYALGRAAKRSIRAGERDGATETDEPQPGPPPLEPGMTPYGPREIDGPREVRGELDPASQPNAHIDHTADYTRPLPVQGAPGYSPPASWAGPVPDRRTA